MITEAEYEKARHDKEAAEHLINVYHLQSQQAHGKRVKEFEEKKIPFVDADLEYSAGALCECCGAGLAYFLGGGLHGTWSCSNWLKQSGHIDGCQNQQYPFAFYEIKSEGQPSAMGRTTRPTTKGFEHAS